MKLRSWPHREWKVCAMTWPTIANDWEIASPSSTAEKAIQRPGPGSSLPRNNSYAALYFPWIEVFDPATAKNILVPPSGHVAGIYARVDGQRGVHKAPANEAVAGALGAAVQPEQSRIRKGSILRGLIASATSTATFTSGVRALSAAMLMATKNMLAPDGC